MALSKKAWRRAVALDTRAILLSRFPATFCGRDVLKKPLKIGIFDDVVAACPDLKKLAIAFALRNYCTRPSYLAAMLDGAARVGLDGTSAGVVSERHAAEAAAMLAAIPVGIHQQQSLSNSGDGAIL